MKPLRIAIAEDNWFIAEHLCGELAALGHAAVGRARTGDKLIILVACERPDLAFADVRLADREANPEGTGDRRDRTSDRCRGGSGGLLGILSKPYTTQALRAVLEGAAGWLESGSSRPS